MRISTVETDVLLILFFRIKTMQENFKAKRWNMASVMTTGGEVLPGAPTVMRNICKKYQKGEICKKGQCCGITSCGEEQGYYEAPAYRAASPAHAPDEGYYSKKKENYCAPNEGYFACNTSIPTQGKVINYSSGRTHVFPQAATRKIAAGAVENFAGRIDSTKYGDFGTSMNKPAETFAPGLKNARMNGGLIDVSWACGTMDGIKRANVQPFTPSRYQQYTA